MAAPGYQPVVLHGHLRQPREGAAALRPHRALGGAMSADWSAEQLALLSAARELRIAVKNADGSLRRYLPIWVVCVGAQVFVRTWYRRDSGWYGRALHSRRVRITLEGLEADVSVEDIGDAMSDLTAEIDSAYFRKYGNGASSMVSATARATTLRLSLE